MKSSRQQGAIESFFKKRMARNVLYFENGRENLMWEKKKRQENQQKTTGMVTVRDKD